MLLLVGNFAFIPCVYSQNGVINPYYPNWIINNTLFPNSALPICHYSNRTGMFVDNRNYNIPENTSYACVLPTNINCRSSTGYLITVYYLPGLIHVLQCQNMIFINMKYSFANITTIISLSTYWTNKYV